MTNFIRFNWRRGEILGGITAAVLSLGAIADTNRVILHEDFESYKTVKALRAVWPGGAPQLITNAPGGGQCVSPTGNGINRRGGFFLFPDATHDLVIQADVYDFATNATPNLMISLNGEDSHDNIIFGLRGTSRYMARVAGFSSKTNFIPFKRGQEPVEGWHRFRAVISTSNLVATLDLGADGTVDRTLKIPFDKPVPTFTEIRFGGYAAGKTAHGVSLVDNIRLEIVPRPISPAAARIAARAAKTNALKNAKLRAALPPPETLKTNALAESPGPERTTIGLPLSNMGTNVSSVPITPAVDSKAEAPRTNTAIATAKELQTLLSNTPAADTLHASQPDVVRSDAPMLPALYGHATWLVGGAFVTVIILLGVVILMLRRQATVIPKAVVLEASKVSGASDKLVLASGPASDEGWRERALQAEAIAAKQAEILKEKVGPELVEFAKGTLVQGLYTQRNSLIETQSKAKETLAELETRLAELQLPGQERIQAYEKRISELEKQLETRGDEMRELTRATLVLVQKKLEQEKRQQGFN